MADDPVPTSDAAPPATVADPPASQPTAAATAPAPAATGGGAEEDYVRGAYKAVEGSAPWKKGARWEVVVTQGVILGIAGLVIWLAPGFGAAAALQLIALLVLVMALLSVWRIMRGRVAPERMATVAFRAGVGVTIGIITVLGAFIVQDRSTGTVALAIVLGVGLVLYGLVAALAALAHRDPDAGFPVVALIIAALTVIVGIMLVVNGRNGIDSLQSTFALLGILMLVVGVVFVGYGLMLRGSQVPAAPADD
jgi:uncharacterized membrane protein HdeD (DUF308 family)